MFGAFIGDIVGSRYEFSPVKTTLFPFFSDGCSFTDDSIMTVAVARGLIEARETGRTVDKAIIRHMQGLGRRFPHPTGGYGSRFSAWLSAEAPEPYGSFGNGSAMRVSACGLLAASLEEAVTLGRLSASVTHDHPEGLRGAEAVAGAIFLARQGESKEAIRAFITGRYYPLGFTLDGIRASYGFDETCQGTVPQALEAFFEAASFEEAIRLTVSLGGDSDTLGAITGSVAWSWFRSHGLLSANDLAFRKTARAMLPPDFTATAEAVEKLMNR